MGLAELKYAQDPLLLRPPARALLGKAPFVYVGTRTPARVIYLFASASLLVRLSLALDRPLNNLFSPSLEFRTCAPPVISFTGS